MILAYKSIEDSSMTSLGNKIREKAKTSSPLSVPDGMVSAINSITNASQLDLYTVVHGYINADPRTTRRQISITGLDINPIGAVFVCAARNSGSDISGLVYDKLTASSYGNLTGPSSQYYPIPNQYMTIGVDSSTGKGYVTLTNPVAVYGTSGQEPGNVKGEYVYIIWGK